MKAIATLAAAAALVTLAGCDRFGGGGTANGAANAAAGNSSGGGIGGKDGGGNASAAAAPAADAAGGKLNEGGGATPAVANGVALDRTYLMGRWADAGQDCSKATELTADGRFITPTGGEALWNLDGDRLTVTGNRTIMMRIVPIDQNTITVINEDGSLGRSTRC